MMHYYPHHIGDFIKETANLNDHQLATYLRMIWAYYLDENPFDNDCESIAFAVRSDEKTVRLLLKHYFELIEDKWHQKRCDREIEHYKSNSEKGRKAAEARWNKHNQKQQTQSEGNVDAMHMHTETDANAMVLDANQEPRTKNHNKYRSAEQTIPDGFESFWNAYDKKKGKQNAINQWKRIKPDDELALLIFKKAKAYASATEVQFRKDPERWLKGRHWEDELTSESPVDEFMAGAI